jgi:hypothetical protein
LIAEVELVNDGDVGRELDELAGRVRPEKQDATTSERL